ncbi:hypothetical protein IDH44_03935 [Paenibacillus sp. IB182496]|uniref:Cellulose biosynthesis protein BcsQ n=1 Tax=Paenibacillus sabuli TaxID=2772509 RepID=A0A927BRS0_9BACL|nr:hypothetical protein [Paenibacillus sabuli]MBD2844329.1 hypothetical protein [Paenibacillus sabuli]
MYALIIAAKEQEYVRRVADYIRDSPHARSWRLTAFTHPPALRQYLRSGYPADMLVLQPEFAEDARDALPEHVPLAILAQGPPRNGAAQEGPAIAQYQPLPALLREIDAVFAGASGRSAAPAAGSGGTVVVAVHAATGRAGRTTLALNLVREAGESGRRVFYLNLELWNAVDRLTGDGPGWEGDELPRMLYALQSRPEEAQAQLAALRSAHPVLQADCFRPPPGPDERLALQPELVGALIEAIVGAGEYDLLVVDADFGMDELYLQMLRSCDLMLWLCPGDAVARRKGELARSYARRKWGEAYAELERRIRICEIEDARGSRLTRSSEAREALCLPFIADWASAEEPMRLLSSPAYRGAVLGLMKRWIWPEGGGADEAERGRRPAAAGAGAPPA